MTSSKTGSETVLLTGASGFIGGNLHDRLQRDNRKIRCATRHPESAASRYPDRDWVRFDVHDYDLTREALDGCNSAFYLIHEMGGGEGYQERERDAAKTFRDAADSVGTERIVYLGGIRPQGEPSQHLSSRLETGEILRDSDATVIELRCSMIIGSGSASWLIVRDLAARLPAMLLPRWTKSSMEPVHVDDVTEALTRSLDIELNDDIVRDLPGPEAMTAEEILERTAQILGRNPILVPVPLLSPKLSSLWLRFVTRADYYVATQLVEGLRNDVLAENNQFWEEIGHKERMSFEDSTKKAIENLGDQRW